MGKKAAEWILAGRIARTQHGVITRKQLAALGISEGSIDHALAQLRLRKLHESIYIWPGNPLSWKQTLMGACLWGGDGTAASHRAAGSLLALDGVTLVMEITGPRRLRSNSVLCHRSTLEQRDVIEVDSIPCTSAAKTLLDLASVLTPDKITIATESALRRQLTDMATLRDSLTRWTGLKGAGRLRRVLDLLEKGIADSPLERRLLQCLLKAGLPEPTLQYVVIEDGNFLGRIDLAYPEYRLAIEADGWTWHGTRAAWNHDWARRNRLISYGWTILTMTFDQLVSRPHVVAADTKRTLTRLGWTSTVKP